MAVPQDDEVIWYATSMPGDTQSINPVRWRASSNPSRRRRLSALLVLAPYLAPQVEPLLERVRPDDDTVVGKIDQFIDGRVMTRPLRPVAAVRIAGLGKRDPVGAGQFAHLLVVAGHFIAENFRRDIEDEGKLRTMQRALHFAALRLSHIGKTVEIGGTAGAGGLV